LRRARAQTSGRLTELVDAAQVAAGEYEAALIDGEPLEASPDAVGPRLRQSFLQFVALRGAVLSHDWLGMAVGGVRTPAAPCPMCASPTTVAQYEFLDTALDRRVLRLCPTCGVVDDRPADMSLSLLVGPDGLRLHGNLSGAGWTVATRLGCQDDRESIMVPWPMDAAGVPEPPSLESRPWPLGSIKISVVAIRGASIAVLSGGTRAPRRTDG